MAIQVSDSSLLHFEPLFIVLALCAIGRTLHRLVADLIPSIIEALVQFRFGVLLLAQRLIVLIALADEILKELLELYTLLFNTARLPVAAVVCTADFYHQVKSVICDFCFWGDIAVTHI